MRSIAIALLLLSRIAAAEPVVLAVDKGTIYIELGARDGVGAGTELELLHAVTVRDPRSGATLRDHFALGTLEIVKSGERISVARADDKLAARVIAGDRVRVLSARRSFEDPWVAKVAASKGRTAPVVTATVQPPVTASARGLDHVELVRAAWAETLGKTPEARIERWLELMRADPTGPYRIQIQNEIASLKSQIAQRDAALATARSVRPADVAPRIARLAQALSPENGLPLALAPIERAMPDRPIRLAFLVRSPDAFRTAQLFVRGPGEPGFRRIELRPDGDAYLRATIEAASVRAPALEWYVEVATTGDTYTALGSRAAPNRIAVEASVTEPPIASGRSHIDAHVDYVDFDGKLGKGFDQYYQAEAEFGYRFLHPVHAVRLGFGTLSGTGGPKDVIDNAPDTCMDETGTFRCRNVNFSYVYTEFEFRLRESVALMVRPQAGLLSTDSMPGQAQRRCNGRNIDGCEFFTGLGLRGRLRLGDENGTHLVLGAGFTDGVGTLLEAAYHWLPKRTLPVQLTVQVTDMPVPEDFGVRLIGDIGWRSLSWFYPSLRLSYQARDIDHAGVSGGVAMNFDW
ncbi:MAG: hypothetical protein ABI867_30875 [Kofleriaceae bacterium]